MVDQAYRIAAEAHAPYVGTELVRIHPGNSGLEPREVLDRLLGPLP